MPPPTYEIHFNTPHIVTDVKRLLDEGSGRRKSKYKLQGLSVGRLSLQISDRVIGTLAMGFADVSPVPESFFGL